MTIEERFASLSADFVVVSQDLNLLRQQAAQMNECCEKRDGKIEEARAVIVALLETCGDGDNSLLARARKWLEEV